MLKELTPVYSEYSEWLLGMLDTYYDILTYRRMLYAMIRTDLACCILNNILQILFAEEVLYEINARYPSEDYLNKIIEEKDKESVTEERESDRIPESPEGGQVDVS